MKLIKIILGFSIILFISSNNVFAWLKICNKTSSGVWTTIAVRDHMTRGSVVSRGWWNIAPGKCKILIGEKLDKRTKSYFYYAQGNNGRKKWSGDYPFCTRDRKYKLRGERRAKPQGSPYSCRAANTIKRYFKEIPVKNKNHTQNLLD